MADDLAGLEARVLRGMLPGLYKQAQEGDGAAQSRVIRIIELLKTLEVDKPAPGFPASIDTPGQLESRAARARLDEMLARMETKPDWYGMWSDLLEERWPDNNQRRRWQWRTALYIAWSCVPRDRRWPRTKLELANLMGCAESAFRVWRHKDPEIDERIRSLPATMLLEHVAGVFDALATVAQQADPRAFQDRRLFLEITGNYQPSGNLAVSMTPISYIEVAGEEEEDE